MTSLPAEEHPPVDGEAHISLTQHHVSFSSRVEAAGNGRFVVRPSVGEYDDQEVVAPGDRVEISWVTGEGRTSVPAQVVGAEHGTVTRWRLEAVGPPERNQRRSAVRGRVTVPAVVGYGSIELTGETLDLSEGGVRVAMDPMGSPPGDGAPLDLVLQLEDGEVATQGELVRYTEARNGRWVMSIRFLDIHEREEDRLRRRVFEALREERAKQTS